MTLTALKKYLYILPVLLLIVLVACGFFLKDEATMSYINLFLLTVSVFIAIVYVLVKRLQSKKRKFNKNKRK